jgi:hydroxymethylglutaryl-CoA reductase (NADPH)
MSSRDRIPRDPSADYTREMAAKRAQFLNEKSGATLQHVQSYSFDPGLLPGNIENFAGVAQVPIGIAGPLRIKGEHAQGDFFVPMATTEGTLVASYNRGMRVLAESGGITTTVVKRSMQRAPVFMFDTAREARDFGEWLTANFTGV